MTEGFLYEIQVAGFVIKPRSEGVPQGVNRAFVYTRCFEPHRNSLLDLAATQPPTVARLKQRSVNRVGSVCKIILQYLFELGIDEDRLLSPAFGCDFNDALFDQYIVGVEIDKRAEPDSGSQQKRDYNEIAPGQFGLGLLDCAQELFGISLGQRLRNLSGYLDRLDKSRRTSFKIACFDKVVEERPDRGFDSIDRDGGSSFTVNRHLDFIRGEEPGDGIRFDLADILIAKPIHKQLDIPQVSQPGMFAFAIGDKLRLKMPDSGFKFHNYLPVLVDSTCHMNGYVYELIKSIMRSSLDIIRNNRSIARIMANLTQHEPAVGFYSEVRPSLDQTDILSAGQFLEYPSTYTFIK